MHRKAGSIAGSAVLLCLMFTCVAPAQAATMWSYDDPNGDAQTSGIDIARTTLDVRLSGYYRVRVRGHDFLQEKLNAVTVYFDVRAANAGPEYKITWGLPDDGVWQSPGGPNYDGNDYKTDLARVDTWKSGGRIVPCAGTRLSKDLDRDVVTVKVPRRCLGSPSRVRWTVQTENVTETRADGSYVFWADGAPAFRRFAEQWVP